MATNGKTLRKCNKEGFNRKGWLQQNGDNKTPTIKGGKTNIKKPA